MMAAREVFSSCVENYPAERFFCCSRLAPPEPPKNEKDYLVARFDEFARHFIDKIACICHDLDSTLRVFVTVPMASVGPVILESFQLVQPEDVDRILWTGRLSASPLDPCLPLLIRSVQEGLINEDKVGGKFISGGGGAASSVKAGSGLLPPEKKALPRFHSTR